MALLSSEKVKQYSDDSGRPLIQVLDWWEWQTGLKYKPLSRWKPPFSIREFRNKLKKGGEIGYAAEAKTPHPSQGRSIGMLVNNLTIYGLGRWVNASFTLSSGYS